MSVSLLNNSSVYPQVTINTQTGAYTFVAADGTNALVQMNTTSNVALTIPPNSSVAYPVGTVLNFATINTGTITITQGSGVTIVSTGATASAPTLRARYSAGTAIQTSANNWLVIGDLA